MTKVKAGSTTIEIKEITNGKPCFRFYYYEGKKRKSKSSKDLAALKVEALAIARRLEASKGRLMVQPDEIADFRKWQETQQIQPKPLVDVVNGFLVARRATQKQSRTWVSLLTTRSKALVAYFGASTPIKEIKAEDINRWIIEEHPQWGEQMRYNESRWITQMWKWAREIGYLPDIRTEAEKSQKFSPVISRAYFLPEEMPAILHEIHPLMLPEAILTGFCGIRSSEVRQASSSRKPWLEWQDLDLDDREITVPPETSKTNSTRYAPIPENAFEMLKPFWKPSGRIAPTWHKRPGGEWKRVATKLGIQWEQNKLRHSFGSHRVGHLRDLGRVSEEMGNSIGNVKRHYDGRVKPKIAAKWWEIVA